MYELQTWCKVQCNYVVCSLRKINFSIIYTLGDLGVSSNLIGLLSLAYEHCSPPTKWIMCDKQNGPQKHFANVSKSEILRTQEDATCIPGNTKKATEFHLPLFAFQAVSGQVFGNHRFHQSKQTWLPCCSWWLLQGSFLNYQQKHQVLLNKALYDYFGECFCTRKHPVFTAVLRTQFHFRLIHCQLLFQFWF